MSKYDESIDTPQELQHPVSMLGYDPDTERRDTEWAIYKAIDAEDSDAVRCARCNRLWYGEGWLCDECSDLEDDDDSESEVGRWD